MGFYSDVTICSYTHLFQEVTAVSKILNTPTLVGDFLPRHPEIFLRIFYPNFLSKFFIQIFFLSKFFLSKFFIQIFYPNFLSKFFFIQIFFIQIRV